MSNLLRLPGFIDIHVHLRDPGQTYKEDFYTGTTAALAGGITTVFDMPNNPEPIFTFERLQEKAEIAKRKAVCDFGLYFGTDGRNTDEFEQVADLVVGLKVYLNMTTGKLLLEDEELVDRVFKLWPKNKIIVVHAEREKVDLAINLCKKYGNKTHITHINQRIVLEKIIEAKKDKLSLTCDVTPHHLFLSKEQVSDKDTSGVTRQLTGSPDGGGISEKLSDGFYEVKPPLAAKKDRDFLWEHLDQIDCLASDHAPHTIEEKKSANPPSGLPGLETMLPLMMVAVTQGRINIDEVIRLTNTNPQKIFACRQVLETYIEVDMEEKYLIEDKKLETKCGWSPFADWEVQGRIRKVFIRGTKVFENGRILVSPGFGKSIL